LLLRELSQFNPTHRNLFALGCLALACSLGSLTYPSIWFWFFTKNHQFLPNLTSGIVALLLLAPIVRGDFLHSHKLSPLASINLLLIFYLTSVFTTMGLQGASWHSWLTSGPTFILTLLVIVMANLNVQRYGELGILALVVFGGANLFSTGEVMGLNGWIFLLASTIGIICMIDLQKVVSRFRRFS
jgi:hypothetical protein